jgi:murein DD-endopeptidase MepM/ murein hydrolase activator NlpD
MKVYAVFWRCLMAMAVVIPLSLVGSVPPAYAAYWVLRPITDGQIDQTYLYDTYNPNAGTYHKGVDFPYPTGTTVRAVASGTVVDYWEDYLNGTQWPNTSTVFGNFVLLRHDQQYAGLYVYSIYAHLAYNSVVPALNQHVNAGEAIAQVDSTGLATGPHLHLQINQTSSANATISNPDPYTISRNPELWLQLLPGTATVIGVVRDEWGNPVSYLRIRGLAKSNPNYTYIYTYWNTSGANRDNVLQENFGTTDVTPGTYSGIYADEQDEAGRWRFYRTLGTDVTITADQVNYVALYLAYLPLLSRAAGGW